EQHPALALALENLRNQLRDYGGLAGAWRPLDHEDPVHSERKLHHLTVGRMEVRRLRIDLDAPRGYRAFRPGQEIEKVALRILVFSKHAKRFGLPLKTRLLQPGIANQLPAGQEIRAAAQALVG